MPIKYSLQNICVDMIGKSVKADLCQLLIKNWEGGAKIMIELIKTIPQFAFQQILQIEW